MRVLITGGFGYVGGRIAHHLQQAGHQVVLGTRCESHSPAWLPQAEVMQTHWHDTQALTQICEKVDAVVHAAGINAQDCAADPVAALEFNGLATARLVTAAANAGVGRFIYLSTAHVYSSPLVGNISENTCPRNLHPYATSHLAGEQAVLAASQRDEVEGIVLRLSNAFGAPMHVNVNCWMSLVNDLCRQAVTNGKLVLTSNGLQLRDFITLEDVTKCVKHFISLPLSSCSDGLFNLGSESAVSVYDMALLIAARCQIVLGYTPTIERARPAVVQQHLPLRYGVNKLKSTGFTFKNKFENEIDTALKLCQIENRNVE